MRLARNLREDRRGVTMVEFGLIAPVFMLLLVGMFDIAHALYLRAALEGAMQKSSRDSTLEGGATVASQAAIDDRVRELVAGLTFGREVTFRRRFYRTFEKAAAARHEHYDDLNGNKRCDAGEKFIDSNNNKVWDADGADEGQGLAFDRAVYTASVTYPRLFPLWRFIGGSSESLVQARTVLMNQPYAGQQSYGAAGEGFCK